MINYNENGQRGSRHVSHEKPDLSVQALEKKMKEMDAKFDQKVAELDRSTKQYHATVGKSYDAILGKLDDIYEANAPSRLSENDVEKEVILESADFAKQLIEQLEQASLMYVKQRQSMMALKRTLGTTEQQLKEKDQQIRDLQKQLNVKKSQNESLKERNMHLQRIAKQKEEAALFESTKAKNVRHETTKDVLYSFLDNVDNHSEFFKEDQHLSLQKYLQDNGVKPHPEYPLQKRITVLEDAVKHSQFVDGVVGSGRYMVTALPILIDNGVLLKGTVEREQQHNIASHQQEPYTHKPYEQPRIKLDRE